MPPTRVCSSTFAREGEGVQLLRCMRCRDTYYVSADAQRAHWKVHKKTCRDVAPAELEEIRSMNMHQTYTAIKNRLQGATPDALTAPLIRRLRANFGEEDIDDQHDAIGMSLHTTCRGLIFSPGYDSEMLWGAPGMTELLLTENLLLSERVRKRLEAGFPNGLPSIEFAQHELTGEAQAEAWALLDSDDEGFMEAQPSYNFCFLYFNLILAAAVHGRPTPCSAHDGRGALQIGRAHV